MAVRAATPLLLSAVRRSVVVVSAEGVFSSVLWNLNDRILLEFVLTGGSAASLFPFRRNYLYTDSYDGLVGCGGCCEDVVFLLWCEPQGSAACGTIGQLTRPGGSSCGTLVLVEVPLYTRPFPSFDHPSGCNVGLDFTRGPGFVLGLLEEESL